MWSRLPWPEASWRDSRDLNGERQSLCERLTQQIQELPGVIPPRVPPDRTHALPPLSSALRPSGSRPGPDPFPSFAPKVVAALGAEGVLCRSWMNWTIPSLPLFTRPEEFEANHPLAASLVHRSCLRPPRLPGGQPGGDGDVAGHGSAHCGQPARSSISWPRGFTRSSSQIDEVAKLQLPSQLLDGGAANLDEIRRWLGPALPVQPT